MEKLSYRLAVFEGPLDLLLALIGKKKVDVCDINITEILEQYMAYLALMEEMDLEITSEFLAMASNLLYIKSQMLLPRAADDEKEDPRLSLAQALVEYQRHKESASVLSGLFARSEGVYTGSGEVLTDVTSPYEKTHDPVELKEAFFRLFEKNGRRLPPPVTSFVGIVGKETAPVSNRLSFLLKELVVKKMLHFFDIFRKVKTRSEIVATFLAVLELTKTKQISVEDAPGRAFSIKILKHGDV